MTLALVCFLGLTLIAQIATAYTEPEGSRLLQDLRNFKGEEVPGSWLGSDPCGSAWEEGQVLSVYLSNWLPSRRLLQAITPQELEILKSAIGVTGTAGDINAAIGRGFPPDSGDSTVSSSFVGPTISAIKSGLQSLLPFSGSASTPGPSVSSPPSPIIEGSAPSEAPTAIYLQPTEALAPVHAPEAGQTLSPGGSSESQALNPTQAPSSSGSSLAEEMGAGEAEPGDALAQLLEEIELIKAKLREQVNSGRKLLADSPQDSFAPNIAAQGMTVAPAPMSVLPSLLQAVSTAVPPVEEELAKAPAKPGVDPSLLPQGYTDVNDILRAVGTSHGIGRRLSAVGPALGPNGAYQEKLAPESAPKGRGGPAGPGKSIIVKNPDGSTTVKLLAGNVGGFELPALNGTIPAQTGVKLTFPGRKLLTNKVVKPANTLLSFASAPAQSSSPAFSPSQGPSASGPSVEGYKEVLAPEGAPKGEGSPPKGSGIPVELPGLQVGVLNLPAVNSTLPKKEEPRAQGRKRLQEENIKAPASSPGGGPAEGPHAYKEKLAPESAPKGEASPGSLKLPAINLGTFRLPAVTLPKPPPKQEARIP